MRPFFIIWGGQAFSLLGSNLVQFALIWYLTTTTGSATVLAIASMIGLLPQILLGPIAGTLVDRWDRRVVMIIADTVIATTVLLLALCFLLNWTPLWLIYLVMFIRSLGSAFHWPAMQASTPLLIPEKHLTRVAALNQGLYNAMNIVPPALAALLLGWLPMQGILAIDVGTAIIAIIPLLFIHIPNPTRQDLTTQDEQEENKPSVLDDLRAGFAFVWGWIGLRIIVGLVLVVNLFFAPANALFPLLVTETFGGGALELAWVQGSVGLGGVLGGLLLGVWGGFKNRMLTSILGLFLQGIGFLIVGFAPNSALLLLMVTMGLMGIANPIINGPFFAALQATVPNAIQGRVLTLISSSLQATTPIGLLIAGPLADRLGVQIIYILCGIVMLMNGIIYFITPSVLHFEALGKQMLDAQAARSNQGDSIPLATRDSSLHASG
ncbi:MFS transporter [Chloroflexi bacterium TSY]|nr:MFS transporter [Chloroflexi bacterium TSY]